MITFLITFFMALIVFVLVLSYAALHTWIERKQSAVMQDRIGANRATFALPWKWAKPINWILRPFMQLGLFHVVADGIKMFTKEDYIPPFSDKFLHKLAPCLALLFSFMGFAAIPFGDVLIIGERIIPLQVAPINVAILYMFAIASMGVYGVVLAGFASNSNYAFLGGLRASSQMLAYEITLGATILGVVMVFESLDLQEIVRAQGHNMFGWLPMWGIFVQPVGFFLFLAAGLAETKRIPYDIPEAESEIVGYFSEYSGMKFGMFFFTDFIETILIAAFATTLFLGGWQVPYLLSDGFHFPWETVWALPHLVVVLLQILSFAVKVIFLCGLFMTVRWTLPRFRFDQLMDLGWKGVFPIAIANIIITAVLLLVLG